MTFNRGDIVFIPFPFTDFSAFKQRPVVIISNNSFNKIHDDIIAMAITSQVHKIISGDEYLLSKEEIKEAGLPKPSIVKAAKIITIHKILIRRKLGNLPHSAIEKIKAILFKII